MFMCYGMIAIYIKSSNGLPWGDNLSLRPIDSCETVREAGGPPVVCLGDSLPPLMQPLRRSSARNNEAIASSSVIIRLCDDAIFFNNLKTILLYSEC